MLRTWICLATLAAAAPAMAVPAFEVPGVDMTLGGAMAAGRKLCRYQEAGAIEGCASASSAEMRQLSEIWNGPALTDADRSKMAEIILSKTKDGVTDWNSARTDFTLWFGTRHVNFDKSRPPNTSVTTTCKSRVSSFYGRYGGTSNGETTCTTR